MRFLGFLTIQILAASHIENAPIVDMTSPDNAGSLSDAIRPNPINKTPIPNIQILMIL